LALQAAEHHKLMWESPEAAFLISVTLMPRDIYLNYSRTLYTDLVVGLFIHINLLLTHFPAVGKQLL